MVILWIITAACLVASFAADWKRTLRALRAAAVRLCRILPSFGLMLVLFSVGITLAPQELIERLLGPGSGAGGLAIAAGIGSLTLMPGFIAFPLSGALLDRGVSRMVLATFTTTLMMVGVATFPLEKQYLGWRVALVRNAIGLVVALAAAAAIGVAFGELAL